ncbi:hypothetical protein [Streptomyces sp. PTD5-9]|uniref:hypothetical protein n=1 Tax=Streptomyces sp. PTD5-9 TaxID=3120150 RepID=UPI003FCDB723
MAFGFVPSAAVPEPVSASPSAAGPAAPASASASFTDWSPNRLSRMLEPAEWAEAGIPLLRAPRDVVGGLHARHRPVPGTAVVAVLDHDERLAASASFARRAMAADGWEFRNALLAHLRRVIPHDLRRRSPVRTAVLLYCREGDGCWTEEDGAWMWGLRDACTLHGLRCGAYITLTRGGWQVLGEGRGGRRPDATSEPPPPAAPVLAAGPPSTRTGGGAARAPRRTAAR